MWNTSDDDDDGGGGGGDCAPGSLGPEIRYGKRGKEDQAAY